ncbi:unnamed protein product [Callosobruchus maculatus]|uniref:Uncharacterized protein n=1 Tax=Callosobruchus maculatus TaxID=64391 RepID=A0A653CFY1_CALMS|nr:unnamed protein product [Callosobruchus maculatus]
MIPLSNDMSVELHPKMHIASSFLAICVISLILSHHFVQSQDMVEESVSIEVSVSESEGSETVEIDETVVIAEDDETVML